MATKWEEVVSDKNKYPDDMVVRLADGTETKLSDLRPGYMKDSDYRQKTAMLARQREDFEAQAVGRLQALQEGEAQLRSIAAQMLQQNPNMTKREVAAAMDDNDDVSQLRAEIAELKGAVKPMAEYITAFDQRAKQARQAHVVNEHRKAMIDLKAKHPDLNEMELLQYAKDRLIPNLYEAHKNMTHDSVIESRVKEAREAAYREGMEKGRVEALAPPALPVRTVVPQRVEGAPKDLREAATKALQDPEVMGPLLTGRLG